MLVKTRVDEYALADALEGSGLSAALRARLAEPFTDPAEAKAALAALRREMPTGGQDELLVAELQEIARDLRWARTAKGRLVLACDRIVPPLKAELGARWDVSKVMIGAHVDRVAVVVAGKAPSQEAKDGILARVRAWFEVEGEVEVVDLLVIG